MRARHPRATPWMNRATHCSSVVHKVLAPEDISHLFPGSAPNTTSEFSCLDAICAFRNARSCERNVSMESGYWFEVCAERCHCVGDRSTMTDKCDAFSMVEMMHAKYFVEFGTWLVLPYSHNMQPSCHFASRTLSTYLSVRYLNLYLMIN